MPTSFAAAASFSISAPGSDGRRRLMIEAKPIFFSPGIASALIAPAQATVVSTCAKLATPGTVGVVT